jgi:hypothetical protein
VDVFCLVHEKVAELLEKQQDQTYAVLAHHYKQGIDFIFVSFILVIVFFLLSRS